MAEQPVIGLTIEAGIARIVFNRPLEGNPISDGFIQALDDVTLECADRKDVRAVIISALGKRFSVGGNILEFASEPDKLSSKIRRWNASLQGSVARLQRMDAPSVVAVNGAVAGGALSIISGCDIIVAVTSANFVAAYATIGYCPDLGGTLSMAKRIGVSRTRRFHLLHETLLTAEAHQLGLVDFVVENSTELVQKTEEIAKQWASGPTLAYAAVRRLMQTASTSSLETQMENETQSLVDLVRTDDAREALRAFLDKAPPHYKGA